MAKPIESYRYLFFDCDGVILNSNHIKAEGFKIAAEPYGSDYANQLVAYHKERGGISRYEKFKYFLSDIIGQKPVNDKELEALLKSYADAVLQGLMECEHTTALDIIKQRFSNYQQIMAVISGGKQSELIEVFSARNLNHYFNGGIFGSPETKQQIFQQLTAQYHIKPGEAIYFGDSVYDYVCAKEAGYDFCFVYQWTEVTQWQQWVEKEQITVIPSLAALIK